MDLNIVVREKRKEKENKEIERHACTQREKEKEVFCVYNPILEIKFGI